MCLKASPRTSLLSTVIWSGQVSFFPCLVVLAMPGSSNSALEPQHSQYITPVVLPTIPTTVGHCMPAHAEKIQTPMQQTRCYLRTKEVTLGVQFCYDWKYWWSKYIDGSTSPACFHISILRPLQIPIQVLAVAWFSSQGQPSLSWASCLSSHSAPPPLIPQR